MTEIHESQCLTEIISQMRTHERAEALEQAEVLVKDECSPEEAHSFSLFRILENNLIIVTYP